MKKKPKTTPDAPARKAIRVTVVSVLANACLAAVKGLAGVLGHSYALIADAMESVMDIMKSLVVLGGIKIATTPPDAEHPYGHGKAEPLAAAVVAVGLIAGAVGLAIQSVREILSPQYGPEPFTLAVLVGVIVTKEIMFRYVARVGEEVSSTAVKTNAWDNRSDALTSAAAFIGILAAVVTGYEAADDWAALFACAVIAYNGARLLIPAIAEVMDTAPPPEIEQAVRASAMRVEGVAILDACWVRKMGFDYFIDLHVGVDGDITVREGHDLAHRVKDAIRTEDSRVRDVLVHVEPADWIRETQKKRQPTTTGTAAN